MADLKMYYLSKFINCSGYCLVLCLHCHCFEKDDSLCAHTNKSSKRLIIKQNGRILLSLPMNSLNKFSLRLPSDILSFDRHIGCYALLTLMLVQKITQQKTNKFAFRQMNGAERTQ